MCYGLDRFASMEEGIFRHDGEGDIYGFWESFTPWELVHKLKKFFEGRTTGGRQELDEHFRGYSRPEIDLYESMPICLDKGSCIETLCSGISQIFEFLVEGSSETVGTGDEKGEHG